MKLKIFLSILAFGLFISAFSQKPTIELTFTAEYNGQYVPLDCIFIENLTQGGDTTLNAPDTVLVLDYVTSIGDNEAIGENSFSVSQNYPNPFKGKTTVNLYLPEKEHIIITIRDILGREAAYYKNTLKRGNHTFTLYPGNEKYYLFTVAGKQTSKTIKMLKTNGNPTFGGECKIVYTAYDETPINFKSQKAINNFGFALGDELRYTGYANTVYEVKGSDVIEDAPETNEIYEFDITEGVPCPGIPTVAYEGQVYNTVLIGIQCWLKENLNVGTMIKGEQNQQNNDTIEKYCYDDSPANCDNYGGQYLWYEMMQYETSQGVQGICPPDWHLPTDEEWKQLEGAADSKYGYPDPVWNGTGHRGFDAGFNLRSVSGWYYNYNGDDLFGFTALPGGLRNNWGDFYNIQYSANFWTSTEINDIAAWYRMLFFNYDNANRSDSYKEYGYSVRCLKN
jgi:uncharacterized protein (TIGR02145 family)